MIFVKVNYSLTAPKSPDVYLTTIHSNALKIVTGGLVHIYRSESHTLNKQWASTQTVKLQYAHFPRAKAQRTFPRISITARRR